MSNKTITTLHGIVPPLVTPLTDQYELDEEAFSKLLTHLIDGGVHGLFVLGTTGEAPSLSDSVKMKLLEQMADEVGTKIPWLVGITDTSLGRAIDWAHKAERMGANAVVAAPPYYFPASQTALYQFFEQLANESPLPLFLYNIPSHTRNRLDRDTIVSLLQLPNFAGYKDSTGDIMHFHWLYQQIAEMDQPYPYFLGPEELLLETTLLGASGGVNGGANIFPELYVRIYEAVKQGEIEKAKLLHRQVMQVSRFLYQSGTAVTAGIKFALAEIGIGNGLVAPPQLNLSKEEKERLRAFLQEFTQTL
jgi:4-hydroxy-tetrahydrodipicolinate synthase